MYSLTPRPLSPRAASIFIPIRLNLYLILPRMAYFCLFVVAAALMGQPQPSSGLPPPYGMMFTIISHYYYFNK